MTLYFCGKALPLILLLFLAGHTSTASGQVEAERKSETSLLADFFLFFPSPYPEGHWKPEGLSFQEVYFESADQTRLHGWYCPVQNPKFTILLLHGNAGNITHRADWIKKIQAQTAASIFVFDYRGYGRSQGRPTIGGVLLDARAARQKLSELATVDSDHLVLMGSSLGGAIAVQLASEEPVRALVLQSTFSSLRDIATKHYPDLAWLTPHSALNSVEKIQAHQGPLLQSHGALDQTIPLELGRRLFESAGQHGRFVVIENAGHNNWQGKKYLQELERFLDSLPPRSITNRE